MSALSAKSLQILQFEFADTCRLVRGGRRRCRSDATAALELPHARTRKMDRPCQRLRLQPDPCPCPPQSHPNGPHRLGHHRRRASRCACRACVPRRRPTSRPRSPRWSSCAAAGAGVVRMAADSRPTPRPWPRSAGGPRPTSRSILQENYRLAADVAPWVDKIRYNPGHLYHHERNRPWQDKVRFLVDVAGRARLRPARGRELRLGRSGPAGTASPRTTASGRCSTAPWSTASCSTGWASRATAFR